MHNYSIITFSGQKKTGADYYTVDFQRPIEDVQELSLVYFDGTVEAPVVREGENAVTFGAGWRAPPNLMFVDAAGQTRYVPPYLNRAVVHDVGDATWRFVMDHPASIEAYLKQYTGAVPSLTIVAGSHESDDPIIYVSGATHIDDRIFALPKSNAPHLQAGDRVYIHRMPWHAGELQDFTNAKVPYAGAASEASIPAGNYDAASVVDVLPRSMHRGYLASSTTFAVREGLHTVHTVDVPAGFYRPEDWAEMIAAALHGTDIDVEYHDDRFHFTRTHRPFLLDFRASSVEWQTTVGFKAVLYGPKTAFQGDEVLFPANNQLVFAMHEESDRHLCLDAKHPPVMDDVEGLAFPVTGDSMVWATRLPYRSDDIIFLEDKAQQASVTARVKDQGYVIALKLFTSVSLGDVITDGSREATVVSTSTIRVFSRTKDLSGGAWTTESGTPIDFQVMTVKRAVWLDVPARFFTQENSAWVASTGFVDPPRFELGASGLAKRLGVDTTLSNDHVYRFPCTYNFRPVPFLNVFVEPLVHRSKMARNRHILPSGEEREPLAKIVSEGSEFQLQRLEVMEHYYRPCIRIGGVRVWFENPDGTPAIIGDHAMTLGFLTTP